MATGPTKEEIRALLTAMHGKPPERDFRVVTDTSDFFAIDYGDVVVLDGVPYQVRGYEKEGRFGLDDEPKFWVRRALDLRNRDECIIKLVFHESFTTKVGEVEIRCFRSPRKEARILDLVRDHPAFMHGRWVRDRAGNVVRILEYIRGRRWDTMVVPRQMDAAGHEPWFFEKFPAILDQYRELVEAIKFLHDHLEKHGDIRRDHILWDRERQCCRWIDFDYNYEHGESMFSLDLLGLGSILIYLTGGGDVLVTDLYHQRREVFDRLYGEDLAITFKHRVANLQKVFPYIPDSLNLVLRHFSRGAQLFYDDCGQLLHDLARARADLGPAAGKGG